MTVRFGRSRSSKVIDFGTNRKCVCDFLLVCHSNLRHILHRFRDIAGFFVIVTPPLLHPNIGGFPFDQIARLFLCQPTAGAETLSLSTIKSFLGLICADHIRAVQPISSRHFRAR